MPLRMIVLIQKILRQWSVSRHSKFEARGRLRKKWWDDHDEKSLFLLRYTNEVEPLRVITIGVFCISIVLVNSTIVPLNSELFRAIIFQWEKWFVLFFLCVVRTLLFCCLMMWTPLMILTVFFLGNLPVVMMIRRPLGAAGLRETLKEKCVFS